jgi:hypothetical protein
MKTVKFALVSIVTISVLTGLTNRASARSNVFVGIGVGNRGFHHGWRHHGFHRPHWGWRHHHPYSSAVIIGGSWWWPDYYPDYYVVETAPVVIERAPVVIVKQTTYVQPQGVNENTFEDLRYKKNELLTMLETGDKDNRIKAINELAGFSFDDKVRQTLENVLLSGPDAELRQSAAQALGEVKNVKAKPALEKARVEDSDADVRKAADESIRKIESSVS